MEGRGIPTDSAARKGVRCSHRVRRRVWIEFPLRVRANWGCAGQDRGCEGGELQVSPEHVRGNQSARMARSIA